MHSIAQNRIFCTKIIFATGNFSVQKPKITGFVLALPLTDLFSQLEKYFNPTPLVTQITYK